MRHSSLPLWNVHLFLALLCIFEALCSWFGDMCTCVHPRRSSGIFSHPLSFHPPLAAWQGNAGTHGVSPKNKTLQLTHKEGNTGEIYFFLVDILVWRIQTTKRLFLHRTSKGQQSCPFRKDPGPVGKDSPSDKGCRSVGKRGHTANLQLRSCTQGWHLE